MLAEAGLERDQFGARALAPLGVGAGAKHRIGVDTADDSIQAQCSPKAGTLPARYGVQVLRISTPLLTANASRASWPLARPRLHAERLPVQRVRAALQVARVHHGLRRLHELVGVEIEEGKDRVRPAGPPLSL